MHLVIEQVNDGDAAAQHAKPLAEWMRLCDKDGIATLTDPDGQDHRVRFDYWNGDVDTTLLSVGFRRYNPELYGSGKTFALPAKEPYEL